MQHCTNEAEFRSYFILLNVDSKNISVEFKHFRKDVQMSLEVRLAIKILEAIRNDDCIKFFSLVRSASYLTTCILFPYFHKMRFKALELMTNESRSFFSISEIVQELSFENIDHCKRFLEHHGLRIDPNEDVILLNQYNVQLNSIPFELCQTIIPLQRKRYSSVSEIVHSCPLSGHNMVDEYKPHNSFDTNG